MMDCTIRKLYREGVADHNAIRVSGWIRTVRDSKAFGFMELNDGSYLKNLQVVLEDGRTEDFATAVKHGIGCSVAVEGELILTPGAQQPFELKADKVTLLGDCPSDYPLQKKRHSPEFLREIAHLRTRTNLFSAVFRLRSIAAQSIHAFFAARDFVYVHAPLITTSDCEGAGEVFQVTTLPLDKVPLTPEGAVDFKKDFFGRPAFLTVSGQLNLEAICMGLRNVYTFGPTFRSEHSNTPRHAAEFWQIEPEIAFADLSDDMDLAQDMITFLLSDVMQKAPEEFEFLNSFVDKGLIERLTKLAGASFARMTYADAMKELEKSGKTFEYPVGWGHDLQTEHERYLTETVFGGPVFVTDWPKEIKSFYMRRNADGKTVAAMDLLVPGVGELIGGSQREERYDVLGAIIDEKGMRREEYEWYLDLAKYGGVKHAGYGMGFERMIMYMTGIANIRDAIPFPRTVGSANY